MKIANERYEVTFVEKGGEILSFLDKETGIQYMYQGDSSFWGGKNPTLFPIVGNTYDGTYEAKGKTYTFKNHGIVRTSTLQMKNHTENSISFVLKANEETKAVYPYDFTYEVVYTLKGNALEVVYHITNHDEETMPFTFGLHPGFKVPLVEGETYADYEMSFECDEEVEQLVFDANKAKPHHYESRTLHNIPMDYDTVEKYATLIYKGYSSSYVTLKGKAGHGLKMSIAGYPFLAVWTLKGAPFVCIEPWYSHADFEQNNIPFAERIGMLSLDSGRTFTTSYTIEIF